MAIELTLVCPVYKVAEYIPQLMKSLLAGVNCNNIEVIFVNDCCPDGSMVLCEQFISQHCNEIEFSAVFIHQPCNQGQAAARNAALKIAKGKYIGFIDSDDVIAENYWQVLKPYVAESKADIIEFDFQEFSSTLPSLSDSAVIELHSSNLNPFYTGFFVWTRLYNRKLIEDITFPEGMIYEDIFYNIHAFAMAISTIRLSPCLVFYRKRDGSTTALRTSQYSQLLINLITAVEQTIGVSPDKKKLILLLQQRTLLSILKGLKISDRFDRQVYYQLCYLKLLDVNKLAFSHGSNLKSTLAYRFACFICWILK